MFNPKYDLSVCNPTFYMVKIVHEIFYTASRTYSKGLIEKMSLDRKCMVTGQAFWPLLLKAIFLLKLYKHKVGKEYKSVVNAAETI